MTKNSKTVDDMQASNSNENPQKNKKEPKKVSDTVNKSAYSPDEIKIIRREEDKRRSLISRVDSLVEHYFSMEEEEAKKYDQIGFFPRVLSIPSMPHSKPKVHEQIRKSGPYLMKMLAPSDVGLPYGAMPRYLVAWLTREVLRKKQREISLGNSLGEFLKMINQGRTGGKTGAINRLKNQFERLLSTSFSFIEKGESKSGHQFFIADRYRIWGDRDENNLIELGKYWIIVSESFYKEAISRPFPFDLRMFPALKGSSMAIDIYFWLTHRMSYLAKPIPIPWEALFVQFGSGYANDKKGRYAFKKKFCDHLDRVLVLYPGARIRNSKAGVLLLPGKPHIQRLGSA